MSPDEYPHTDMPTSTNETTQDQECRSSDEIYFQSYADSLCGTNNICDSRGVNNTCDVCEYTYVLMEID